MTQRLTLDHPFALLELPFALGDHLWLQGNPYISKAAIRRRLTQVDPRWSLSEPRLIGVQDDLVIMSATLTVLDSARSNIGTGVIQHADPDAKTGVVSAFNEAKLLAKAYKSAASDLLPRCAQQFGVGWYLLDMNKDLKRQVSTPDGLRRYLENLQPAHWAKNGGGERFKARMNALGLDGAFVLANLEAGRALKALSETTLSETEALAQLDALANR